MSCFSIVHTGATLHDHRWPNVLEAEGTTVLLTTIYHSCVICVSYISPTKYVQHGAYIVANANVEK